MSQVTLIGTGVMGSAVLASAVSHVGPEQVRVFDVRADVGKSVAADHGVRFAAGLTEAVTDADVVVLAVKPYQIADVLGDIGPNLQAGAIVVSLAVGVTTASMAKHLPDGAIIVRVMPNTPATIGQGVSVLSGGSHAKPEHLDLVSDLLAGTGYVTTVPENQQDVVSAISGSGPAYVFYLIDALAEAGVLGGLTRDLALDLAARTVAGAGAMAAQSSESPSRLREQVSSPGGTTVTALNELDDRAVRAAFVAAARRAWTRAGELDNG